MKRFLSVLIVLTLSFSMASNVLATGISPYANEYYADASVAFNSSGKAVFSALTTFVFSTMKVTSCTLEVKIGSTWRSATTLTPPTTVSKNDVTYDAEKSYASSCTTGNTYRIKATFDADGHTITKTSGSAKYSGN